MHRQSLLSADEKAMEGISDDQDSDFFDENMQDNSAQITSNEDTKEEDQEESDVTAPLKEVNPEVLPPKPMDSPFMKQILPNPNEDSDTDDSGALESDDKRKRLSLTEAGSFKEKVKEIKARIGLAKKRVIKSNHSKKTVPRAKENFESDSVDDKVKENVESDSVDDEVQTVDQSLYSSG